MTRPTPRKSGLSQMSPLAPAEPQQNPIPIDPHADEVTEHGKQGQGSGHAAKVQPAQDAQVAELLNSVKVTTQRQSAYLTPYELNDARAAFLADWQNGGQDDHFAQWIGSALLKHALRTPREREQLARATARVRSDSRSGDSRSWHVPATTIQRMRKAIADDNAAGSWPTDSLWVGDAIAAAVTAAKARNGGTLPTPPRRLPNKLKRA